MGYRDKLTPIPRDQWPLLRDMFLLDWPKHQVAYHTIQNYINWVQIDPEIRDLEVLALNNSWRENGTFIILDQYQMYLHTLEKPQHSLKRALQLIDWNYSYSLSCVEDSFLTMVAETLKTLSVDVVCLNQNHVYELSKEKCLKLDVSAPEGLHFRKLKIEHAIIANKLWPHRCEGTEYFFKCLASRNPSVGLFNDSGELMAWCFCWPTGALGPLGVAKGHCRKGYGSMVLKAIAKEIAKTGRNCFGTVIYSNVASNEMFKKVGFKIVGAKFYLRTRAKKVVGYNNCII